MQEVSSLSLGEGGGGCSFFHLRAIHLLAVSKAIFMNLMILVPLCGSIDISPNRANLGLGGIFILVNLDVLHNDVSQW